MMHVQDTMMAVPRSIGDFFTWGPVVTDAAYYREFRLRPGPVANMTVRHPLAAMQVCLDFSGVIYLSRGLEGYGCVLLYIS